MTPENKNNTHLKMKLLFIGTVLLLASAVHADQKKEENKAKVVSSKPTPVSNPAKAPQLSHIPKSHSFVRHSRKLAKPLRPRLKPSLEQKLFGKYAAPRQWRSKAPLRKAPLRKRPRKLPNFKSRQATPVRLPAFQNRPIQPIPSLRPVQVVPAVERNPRFRRLVSNLRQSASSLRHGIERGNSNLRQSFRTIARNPLPFRPPFSIPGSNHNRRNVRLPAIVFKRAEDMTGYSKFTLDEVIYPEKEASIANRVDTEENVELVDTPLDIDPRNKNKNVQKEPAKEVVQADRLKRLEKLKEKISPKEFGLRR